MPRNPPPRSRRPKIEVTLERYGRAARAISAATAMTTNEVASALETSRRKALHVCHCLHTMRVIQKGEMTSEGIVWRIVDPLMAELCHLVHPGTVAMMAAVLLIRRQKPMSFLQIRLEIATGASALSKALMYLTKKEIVTCQGQATDLSYQATTRWTSILPRSAGSSSTSPTDATRHGPACRSS